MVMLKGGKNPVLAHLFINHMLDAEGRRAELRLHRLPAAAERRSTPTRWSPTASSRRTCASAVVKPEYFDTGYRLLELDAGQRRRVAQRLAGFKAGGGLTVAVR